MAKTHQCADCQEYFEYALDLWQHQGDMGHYQIGELPEYCWMCNCRFKTFEACVEHMDAEGHSFWQFLDESGDESLPVQEEVDEHMTCLLYTSPSPRD